MADEWRHGPGGPDDPRGREPFGPWAGRMGRRYRRAGGYPLGARLAFGLLVMGLGVLFTLDNLDLVRAGDVLRWWPALVLGYGLMRLTGAGGHRNVVGGALFTAAGTLLMLRAAGALDFEPWDFWPVILVLVGLSMVSRAFQRAHPPDGAPAAGGDPAAGSDPAAAFHTIAFWAGIERKVTSREFRGGDVTAVMGGAEIDLRGARMQGDHAVVDVTALWGGVELFVPADWRVSIEALPLLAGIEDSSHPPAGEVRGHLVVRGVVLMGGLEVKN
jgi:hypothetical protein